MNKNDIFILFSYTNAYYISDLSVFRNKNPRKLHHFLVQKETDNMIVQAKNFSHPVSAFNYVVLLYNQNNSVVISSIVNCDAVKFVFYINNLNDHNTFAKEISQTYSSKRILLDQSFGSRKQRLALNSIANNQINVENIDENIVMPKEKSLKPKLQDEVSDDLDQSLLPPYNSFASSLDKVFTSELLIPDEISDHFTNCQFKDIPENEIPKFILIRLKIHSKIKVKRSIIIFLYCLFIFKDIKASTLNNIAALSKFYNFLDDPQIVLNFLTSKFCEQIVFESSQGISKTRYKITSKTKDKILIWMFVSILILDNFKSNITDLSLELSINSYKIANYFKYIGCSIESSKRGEGSTIVTDQGKVVQLKWAILKHAPSITLNK